MKSGAWILIAILLVLAGAVAYFVFSKKSDSNKDVAPTAPGTSKPGSGGAVSYQPPSNSKLPSGGNTGNKPLNSDQLAQVVTSGSTLLLGPSRDIRTA